MAEAIERFEILVRHGAICSRLEIASLLEAYKEMKPSLHRYCNSQRVVDVDALLYSSERLPKEIFKVQEILIQADAPDRSPRREGVVRLEGSARRRPVFQVGDDVIIVVAREGRTELLDLITLLCSYQLEAVKIAQLLQGKEVSQELERVVRECPEDESLRNRLLARLAFELGTTDDLLVELDNTWDGQLLERLYFLKKFPPQFVARLHRDYTIEASRSRAKKWAKKLKDVVDSLSEKGPVHIVSSNTHSTVNLLTAFALQVEKELWSWALQESEHRDFLSRLERRPPELTYFLLKDWLRSRPEGREEKALWEKNHGVVHLEDEHYTGVHSQVISLRSLDPQAADPRLRQTLAAAQKDEPIIVNFDYAFGEQAGILVEQLFQAFGHRIESFSIMGKAGTVVGGRGGIMLPTYLIKEGSRDVYDLPFGNALKAEDLKDLNIGEIHHGGPMLTVAGTILQNERMLRKYREEWKILGLEMEGIPYVRALHQCLKREWVKPNLKVLVGYYASDAPLEPGETLARELAFEGLTPTYGLNIAILRRILGGASPGETREDWKPAQSIQVTVESSAD